MRAGEIIKRLQAFVRKSDGAWSTFDVNDSIRDATAILAPLTQSTRASIRFELHDLPAVVDADRVQLEQVLVNLVRNALEAIVDSDVREITVRSSVLSDKVQIAVEDAGPAIPSNEVDQIFDAFFTTKESGLGMGLAISRTIIEAHNGRIWAEPGSRGGLAVSISLPLSKTIQHAKTARDHH